MAVDFKVQGFRISVSGLGQMGKGYRVGIQRQNPRSLT